LKETVLRKGKTRMLVFLNRKINDKRGKAHRKSKAQGLFYEKEIK
jgi:hypothetical protein